MKSPRERVPGASISGGQRQRVNIARAPADEPLRYGLVGGKRTFNPVRIALGEWIAMLHDVRKAAGARAKFRALFGPPGT